MNQPTDDELYKVIHDAFSEVITIDSTGLSPSEIDQRATVERAARVALAVRSHYLRLGKTEPVSGGVTAEEVKYFIVNYTGPYDPPSIKLVEHFDVYPRGTVARLQTDYTNMKEMSDKQHTAIQEALSTIRGLKAENDRLKNQNRGFQDQYESDGNTVRALRNEVSQLKEAANKSPVQTLFVPITEAQRKVITAWNSANPASGLLAKNLQTLGTIDLVEALHKKVNKKPKKYVGCGKPFKLTTAWFCDGYVSAGIFPKEFKAGELVLCPECKAKYQDAFWADQ